MKRKIVALMLAVSMLLTFTACGDSGTSDSKTEQSEKKEYISDDQISELFSNPDKFKGKYVKLTGQIFTEPEKNEDLTGLQIYQDPTNMSNNFIVHYNGSESFAMNDYVVVDGKINGTFEGENLMGATLELPLIESSSIEKSTYIDTVVPTLQTVTPENLIAESNGVSVKLDKVEYAEAETRFYVTVTNSSENSLYFYSNEVKIVQNGTQIEPDNSSMSVYEGDYPEISTEILPGVASSGIIVFPKMDSSTGFELHASGTSDNWDIGEMNFTLKLNING